MSKTKLSTVLSDLLEKAGIDSPLDIKELESIEIPVEVGEKLLSGLMSMAAAKNNPELQKHYIGKFLPGTLENTKRTLLEYGFTEEEAAFVDDAKIPFKEKNKMVLDLVNKRNSEKDTKSDSSVMKNEIIKLNGELAELKKTHIPKTELEKIQGEYSQKMYQSAINSLSSKINWSENERQKSPELLQAQFNAALQMELQQSGAVAVLDDNGQIVLRQAANKEMEYYDKQNKKPNIETFINELALKNKFVSVSGSDQNNSSSQNSDSTKIIPITGGDTKTKLTPVQQLIGSTLDSLTK